MAKKTRQQPLRGTAHVKKDMAETYQKNEGTRKIHITEDDPVKVEEQVQDESKEKKEPKIKFDDSQVNDNEVKETAESSANDSEKGREDAKSEELDAAQLKDQLIRKAAELENYRRRTQREKQDLIEYGNKNLLFRLLDITDSFDKAFEAGEKSGADEKMLEGFRMIYTNLLKIFEENNVKEIEIPKGTKFDVQYHEAIMAMDSDLPEGTIVHVAQKGYTYGEKVLRHTKVVTSKGAEG